MKIAIVGTGYVGLVTGTCLAEWGHQVTCIDQDADKINGLKAGVSPIFEPGIEDLIARGVARRKLAFTTSMARAVREADVVFIAVGTPSAEDGDADLSAVFAVARSAAQHLRDGSVLVIKSTVPVGTGDRVEKMVRAMRPDLDFSVASNPEFLREGSAIRDFMEPDRVVIGVETAAARDVLLALYAPVAGVAPVLVTQRRTSELIKYSANAFLATKIAFINEMADLCERLGADIEDLANGIGLDKRIGRAFLNPGPGYGGSCFPKDTQALLRTAQGVAVPLRIVEEAIASNIARKRSMALRVKEAADGNVANRTIAVLGLAFKANTDDMRDSPSLPLIAALQRQGATIRAFDPVAMERAATLLNDVTFCADAYDCATGADLVLVVTEWEEFRRLNLDRLKKAMAGDALVDLRNLISPEGAEAAGLRLTGIGKGAPRAASIKAQPAGAPDRHFELNL